MQKDNAIEAAQKAIKEIGEKAQLLKSNIGKCKNDIFVLQNLEKTLLENMEVLRTEGIVASALEYKKSKNDLEIAQKRIVILKEELQIYLKSLSIIDKRMIEYVKELSDLLTEPTHNIIKGNFGKKHGQS